MKKLLLLILGLLTIPFLAMATYVSVPTCSSGANCLLISTTTGAWLAFSSTSVPYLSTTSAATLYVPFTYASSTFPSFTYGSSTYQTALTNPVTGTGSVGYDALWQTANTLGSDGIYSTSTYINIGTTTAKSSLFIQGTTTQNILTVASSSGATDLTVLSNGNVGIDENNPLAALVINGASSNSLELENAAGSGNYYKIGRNSTTGLLDFNGTQGGNFTGYTFTGGNMSVGTSTAPTSLLSVMSSSSTEPTFMVSSSSGTTLFTVMPNIYGSSYGPVIIGGATSTGYGYGVADIVGDNPGGSLQLLIQGATTAAKQMVIGYNVGSNYGEIQSIDQGVSQEPIVLNPNTTSGVEISTSTQSSTALYVEAGSAETPLTIASSTGAAMFTILKNGNIGIGTSTAGTTLDVDNVLNTGITNSERILNTGTGVGTGERLGLSDFGGTDNAFIQGVYTDATNFQGLEFGAGGSGATNGTVKMTLLGMSGYLGIGTTTPATQLQIVASSTIRIGVANTAYTGCMEMFDSIASTTLEYIYTSSGTLVATSTKPSFCQ